MWVKMCLRWDSVCGGSQVTGLHPGPLCSQTIEAGGQHLHQPVWHSSCFLRAGSRTVTMNEVSLPFPPIPPALLPGPHTGSLPHTGFVLLHFNEAWWLGEGIIRPGGISGGGAGQVNGLGPQLWCQRG